VSFHAIEITLTRPATPAELRRAAKELPLAPDAESRHLMTVVRAATPAKALRRTRRRLGHLLPIDVLASHYPDSTGSILLNVDLPADAYGHLKRAARRLNRSPSAHLAEAVERALAEAERDKARLLDAALDSLLTHSSPHQLLAAAARTLDRPTTTHGVLGC
jgi:hypothetical protein